MPEIETKIEIEQSDEPQTISVCVEFEVFCGICRTGICSDTDVGKRITRNGYLNSLTVTCHKCQENIDKQEKDIERLEKQIRDLESEVEQLRDCGR